MINIIKYSIVNARTLTINITNTNNVIAAENNIQK